MNFKINIGNFSFKGENEQVELSDVNVEVEDLHISEIGDLISTLKDVMGSEVAPAAVPTSNPEVKRSTQAMATLRANNERRRQELALNSAKTTPAPVPVEESVEQPAPKVKQDHEAPVQSEGDDQRENEAVIPPFLQFLEAILSEPTPGCDCQNCQAKKK